MSVSTDTKKDILLFRKALSDTQQHMRRVVGWEGQMRLTIKELGNLNITEVNTSNQFDDQIKSLVEGKTIKSEALNEQRAKLLPLCETDPRIASLCAQVLMTQTEYDQRCEELLAAHKLFLSEHAKRKATPAPIVEEVAAAAAVPEVTISAPPAEVAVKAPVEKGSLFNPFNWFS